ncbi:MAG: NfeD family protein [Endomicrobiia bacterium]|jgi:membrane protein implicated in regulation of membrane protease activity|nr:NfeD family protein [Endomicrobiaceae bacterium]MDD3053600.1 NfeD family protein [Endomicrobiaceae bacterium]MDD3922761.1 NfeD family protein [Endomicrobiaceae bacterium]MDD5102497.1 NfeD family protein [Endomicrobiaceae bacterium]
MLWYFWLFAFLAFLGIEIITTGVFFFLCFSLGSLFAMMVSLLGASDYISIVVFCAISLVSVLFIRPIMKRYISKKKIETNVDSLIGAPAVVTEIIKSNKIGKVKVAGEIWLAVSEEEINTGETVVIISVNGTKLIVKKNI